MPARIERRQRQVQEVQSAIQQIHRYFLISLAIIGTVYTIMAIYRVSARATPDGEASLVAALIPTGDVATDARAFLDAAKRDRIALSLTERQSGVATLPVASQSHPLLGKAAPSFRLSNETGKARTLAELNSKGPVLIVFYYGYHCSHCVAQLFALNDEIQRFRDLGVEVIAISPDTSEETSRKFVQYGKFDFPVLADVDHAVAQQFGVYQPPDESRDEMQKHGTFLLNRDGLVIWAFVGSQPFLDNDSLRFRVAEASANEGTK
jgi:peroxiredoxin Q/BCP